MPFQRQLFIPNKRDYITGNKRPEVKCIICSIIENSPEVTNLLVWKNEFVAACANLYPYNAGHLLLFPARHINDPRELSEAEFQHMNFLLGKTMDVLDEIYKPAGYNIGYNVGEASGASIEHLHQHVVPRYSRVLGFVDITAGAKIIIEDPATTLEKLKEAFDGFTINT
jgi:ATP adenylyltransferase